MIILSNQRAGSVFSDKVPKILHKKSVVTKVLKIRLLLAEIEFEPLQAQGRLVLTDTFHQKNLNIFRPFVPFELIIFDLVAPSPPERAQRRQRHHLRRRHRHMWRRTVFTYDSVAIENLKENLINISETISKKRNLLLKRKKLFSRQWVICNCDQMCTFY